MSNRFRLHVSTYLVAVLIVHSPAFGQAAQTPDAIDLRSMYCLRVLTSVPVTTGTRASEIDLSRSIGEDVNRLRAYLLPRANGLDVVALLAARGRADTDLNRAAEDASSCWAACKAPASTGTLADVGAGDRAVTCFQRCYAASEAGKRIGACRPVNWLPF